MISVFFHVYTVNHYQSIVDEFLSTGHDLLEECNNFFVYSIGDNEILNLPAKAILIKHSSNNFEFDTLNAIRQYSIEEDSRILYCHTKGASTPGNECIDDWRRYMWYFLLTKYKECISYLDNYESCGVDLIDFPLKHYSGNCWWSKSSHIKTLPDVHDIYSPFSDRHKCEFWLTSQGELHQCMHQSGVNIFERHLHRISKQSYEAL